MPSTTEIAKLFGFIAKESAAGEHIANAAMGVAAKGVYNVATGNDLSDGLIGAGVAGAGIGVGLKTYKNIGKAGVVAGAMERAEKDRSKLNPLLSKWRSAKGAERATARSAARAELQNARKSQKELTGWANDMKLRPTAAAKAPANSPVSAAPAATGATVGSDAAVRQSVRSAPAAGQHAVSSNQPVQKQGLFRSIFNRGARSPQKSPIASHYGQGTSIRNQANNFKTLSPDTMAPSPRGGTSKNWATRMGTGY